MWSTCLYLLLLSTSVHSSVDNDRINRKTVHHEQFADVNEFNTNSLNYVYAKVQKRVDLATSKMIFQELLRFDEIFWSIKQEQMNGKDAAADLYSTAERDLRRLLREYDIEDILEAILMKNHKYSLSYPLLTTNKEYDDAKHMKKQKEREVRAEIAALFTDKSIVKLYYRAIEAGFSDADLATLKEEFIEYETKLRSYREKLNELTDRHQKGNSVLKDDDEMDDEKLETDLKTVNRQLNEQLKQFEVQISNATTQMKFTHERVKNLYIKLQKSGLSDSDKQNIMSELEEFERKLDKLQWLQREHTGHHARGDDEENMAHGKHNTFDADKAQRKLKEQTAKLDKYEAYLSSKILTRHTEL